MDNLKEKTANGLWWAAMSNGAQQLVMLLIGIVLARILSVEDYGLVAMLTAFSLLATNLQESGFTSVLCVKETATEEDYNSVFWFNIGVSACCYFILFFAAPLIADFNDAPQLTLLARVMFLNFFIAAFNVVPTAYLLRNLLIRQKTSSQVVASILSGVAGIAAAVAGWGCWSLVAMDLTYKLTYTLQVTLHARWRPSLHFDLRPAWKMFGFSSRLLATNVLTTCNNQLIQVLMGHFFPPTQVGLYSQANKWNTMGYSTLSGMVGNVGQPVLARTEGGEERRVRVFRKLLRFTAFCSFPAMLGLAVIAPEFISLTIGEKWMPCVPLLQTLCVAGAFIPVGQMFSNLLIVGERSDLYLRASAGFMVCQIGLLVGLRGEGLATLLAAVASLQILWLFVWHALAHHLVGLTLKQTLLDVFPFAAAALVMVAAAWWGMSWSENVWVILCGKVLIAVLTYCLLMRLAGASVFRECVDYLLHRKK